MMQTTKTLNLETRTKEELEAIRPLLIEKVKREPNHFSAWLELGNVSRRLGNLERAVECYRMASKAKNEDYRSYLASARVLEEREKMDSAAWQYQRALSLCGENRALQFKIHQKMGHFRMEQGHYSGALDSFRQAQLTVQLSEGIGSFEEVCGLSLHLSETMLRLGLTEEAHLQMQNASLSEKQETLNALAETAFRFNLWREAVEVLKKAIALNPEDPSAHYNLAKLQADVWMLEEALVTLKKAKELGFEGDTRSMEAAINGRTGDSDHALKLYNELALENPTNYAVRSSAAMSALYSDKMSAQEVADLHKELFEYLREGERTIESFKNDKTSNRPIRVGFVTADFHHQHPVNVFLQPMLKVWDYESFPVTVYFTGVSYDEQTHKAKNRVTRWREMTHTTQDQFARQVVEDQIDILIDLSGHTSQQRMAYFAKRMAPVQMTYLGYPGSTGVPNIDYLIGDTIVTPIEHQALYTEKLSPLSGTVFCFAPEENYPYPVYGDKHLKRPLTFGSFNNITKLTHHTLALWAKILQELPDSRLLLKAPSFLDELASKRFSALFEELGVAPSRIEFRGPCGLTDMMAEYEDVDIALDPIPYNGGTTTLQAMWMGVPVVVKEGNNFVSRMGASFMSAAGCSEWVAKNDDEYVAIAVKMGKDRKKLLALKQVFRKHLLSKEGWDVKRHTINFQNLLQEAWGSFCL